MPGHNFNHFTGKTRSVKTKPRKKKQKRKRTHKNKYEMRTQIVK